MGKKDDFALDKNLIEMAAKAAGYKVEFLRPNEYANHSTGDMWNPLEFNEDAKDLQMRLRIRTRAPSSDHPFVCAWNEERRVLFQERVISDLDDNFQAAARRVVVRVAAAMSVTA